MVSYIDVLLGLVFCLTHINGHQYREYLDYNIYNCPCIPDPKIKEMDDKKPNPQGVIGHCSGGGPMCYNETLTIDKHTSLFLYALTNKRVTTMKTKKCRDDDDCVDYDSLAYDIINCPCIPDPKIKEMDDKKPHPRGVIGHCSGGGPMCYNETWTIDKHTSVFLYPWTNKRVTTKKTKKCRDDDNSVDYDYLYEEGDNGNRKHS